MAEFDNTNRGSVWPNKRKEKDTHPDFTGSLNVDGVDYWVSAWRRKEGASPESPSLTFSVRPKEQSASKPAARKPVADDMDSEIPF